MGRRGATIYILTDSQAALRALVARTCDSKLIWECICNLKKLATGNHIMLWWVPGHSDIAGNMKADELAKQGAKRKPIGPEPFCGLHKSHIKETLNQWEETNRIQHWQRVPGQRQAKLFIKATLQKAREATALNRTDLRFITGLFTGHIPLKYHLHKIGAAVEATCRLCGQADETAEHILCECEAAAGQRLNDLGGDKLKPQEIGELNLRAVISFFNRLKLL